MASIGKSEKTSSAKQAAQKSTAAAVKPAKTKPRQPAKSDAMVKAGAHAKAASAASVAKPARSPRKRKPEPVPAMQRMHYIEVAAYHIAERRGFAPGDPLEDWIQAEAEIDRLLAAGHLGS